MFNFPPVHTWLAFLLLLIGNFCIGQTRYTWTGASSTTFGDAQNWNPTGVPGPNDEAYANLNNGSITINTPITLSELEIINGNLELNGALDINGILRFRNLDITGSAGNINAEQINFGGSNQEVTVTQITVLNAPSIRIAHTTFNASTSWTKTGSENDFSAGNNRFEVDLSVNLTGTGNLTFAGTLPDYFGGEITVSINNGANLQFAFKGDPNIFQENVRVVNLDGALKLGQSGGVSVFKNNSNIVFEPNAYQNGDFWMKGLIQEGTSAWVITTSGANGLVQIEDNCRIRGAMDIRAPAIKINNSIFDQALKIEKTGNSNSVCKGGNQFRGAVEITCLDSGFYLTGNEFPDRFEGTLLLQSLGTGNVFVAHQASGNEFLNSVSVTSRFAGGVRFGFNGGESIFSDNSAINIGTNGFSGGTLVLGNLQVQNTTPWDLTLTDSSVVQLNNGGTYNNNLTFHAPAIRLDSCVFNGNLDLTKTGPQPDSWQGGSVFNGAVNLWIQGKGSVYTANNHPEQFNNSIAIRIDSNNTTLGLAHKTAYNIFGGSISLDFRGNATLRFGQNGGHAIFQNGAQFLTPNFEQGTLSLDSCEIPIGTNLNINAPFTSNKVELNNCAFSSPLTLTAGRILISQSNFLQALTIEKTGEGFDTWFGGNVFSNLFITNNGSGTLVLGDRAPDSFNAVTTIRNLGSGNINLWHRASGSQINNDLILIANENTIAGGLAGGLVNLNNNAQIDLGQNEFSNATFNLQNIIQANNATNPLRFQSSSDAELRLDSCSFKTDVSIDFGNVFFQKNTFDGRLNVVKHGRSNNLSGGGNLFSGVTTIQNSDSGVVGLANGLPDVFRDSLYLYNYDGGVLSLGYKSGENRYEGPIVFGGFGGTTRFGQEGGENLFLNQIKSAPNDFRNAEIIFEACQFSSADTLNISIDSSSKITLGTRTEITQPANFIAGGINLDSAQFNAPIYFEKTGDFTDAGRGGNRFLENVTVRVSGTGIFQFSNRPPGDTFEKNVLIQPGNGTIKFGTNEGETHFNPGFGILNLNDEPLSGTLNLAHTTIDSTNRFLLEATDSSTVFLGPESIFKNSVTLRAGSIGLNNSTFENTCHFQNFGASYLLTEGGSTFKDSVHFEHVGTSGWGFQENTFEHSALFSIAIDSANFFIGDINAHGKVFFNDLNISRLNLFPDRITLLGTQPEIISVHDSIQEIKELIVGLDSGVALSRGRFFVKDDVVLNHGILKYSDHPLILGPSVDNVAGNSESFIEPGVIKKGGLSFTLPLGAQGQYRPIGFFKNQNDNSEIEVNFVPSNFRTDFPGISLPGNVSFVSTCGYWFVSNATEKVLAPVVYAPRDSACFPFNAQELSPLAYTTGNLIPLPNTPTTPTTDFFISESDTLISENFILVPGVADVFRPFAFPLTEFIVYRDGDLAQIEFTTAFERDNLLYELQRAIDSGPFIAIDQLPAGPNPNSEQSYNFQDTLGVEGLYRYRIRQESIFGASTYTENKIINLNSGSDLLLYPNPISSNGVTLEVLNNTVGLVKITVFDPSGKRIETSTWNKDENPIQISLLQAHKLRTGMYFLEVETPGNKEVLKILNP